MDEFKPGELIAYFLDGWRYGYFEEIRKGDAIVRPIGPHAAKQKPRAVKVPLDNIRKP